MRRRGIVDAVITFACAWALVVSPLSPQALAYAADAVEGDSTETCAEQGATTDEDAPVLATNTDTDEQPANEPLATEEPPAQETQPAELEAVPSDEEPSDEGAPAEDVLAPTAEALPQDQMEPASPSEGPDLSDPSLDQGDLSSQAGEEESIAQDTEDEDPTEEEVPEDAADTSDPTRASGTTQTVTATGASASCGPITVTGLDAKGTLMVEHDPDYDPDDYGTWSSVSVVVAGATGGRYGTLRASSSDTSVVQVESGYETQSISTGSADKTYLVYFNLLTNGSATVTISFEDSRTNDVSSVCFAVGCCSRGVMGVAVAKASATQVKISWNEQKGVDGYVVYRASRKNVETDNYGFVTKGLELVKTVAGAKTTTVAISAPWDWVYYYYVRPYVLVNGEVRYTSFKDYPPELENRFTLPTPKVSAITIAHAGGKKLKVSWKSQPNAVSYELWRSNRENVGYKRLKVLKGLSYVDTVELGTTFYYKVIAVYSDGRKASSNSLGKLIPVSTPKADKTKPKSAVVPTVKRRGTPVGIFVKNSRIYVVDIEVGKLRVTSYTKQFKRIASRVISLPAYDRFGGFYHAPDGNNYVVLGYDNLQEKSGKVVVKVIQYSGSWKKGKTAVIRSSGDGYGSYIGSRGDDSRIRLTISNQAGIYQPFKATDTSFDLQGTTLYVMSGKTGFAASDGYHHQSEFGFVIDTKTMTARESNVSFTSHSFGQGVRFKDSNLFLANHGDGSPRGMHLTVLNSYRVDSYTSKTSESYVHHNAYKAWGNRNDCTTFDFMGEGGDNHTGASFGGMEVGPANVLICGCSAPQSYGVKGVKGFDCRLKYNLFVTVTNRTTGKNSRVWLTNYHPKTSKVSVEECIMVKIADNRFGILYETQDNAGRSSVRYMVIDGSGKKVFSRILGKGTLGYDPFVTYSKGYLYWCYSNYGDGVVVNRIAAL